MNIFSNNAIKIVGVLCCLLIITACGGEATSDEGVPTEAALAPVVVVIATETPTSEVTGTTESETAVSDSETETEEQQQSTITTLVALNVRDEPSTAGEVVYVLDEGATVEVVGESDDGAWWEVVCAVETVSECWTSSSTDYSVYNDGGDGTEETAVSSTDSSSDSTAATATPTAASSSSEEATATATTAAAEATATTAPTATAEPTATTAPTATATTAAQTASGDNDSASDPAMFTTFSPGTKSFSYSNDISYEGGDQGDWVAFEFPSSPNSNQQVWVTLTCTITGDSSAGVRATVYENQSSTSKYAACNGGEVEMTVNNQNTQQVNIHFNDPRADTYVSYTISVVGFR